MVDFYFLLKRKTIKYILTFFVINTIYELLVRPKRIGRPNRTARKPSNPSATTKALTTCRKVQTINAMYDNVWSCHRLVISVVVPTFSPGRPPLSFARIAAEKSADRPRRHTRRRRRPSMFLSITRRFKDWSVSLGMGIV